MQAQHYIALPLLRSRFLIAAGNTSNFDVFIMDWGKQCISRFVLDIIPAADYKLRAAIVPWDSDLLAIALGDDNNEIRVLKLSTGKLLEFVHKPACTFTKLIVRIYDNMRIIGGHCGSMVMLWNYDTGVALVGAWNLSLSGAEIRKRPTAR